jgi:hypothetical protein
MRRRQKFYVQIQPGEPPALWSLEWSLEIDRRAFFDISARRAAIFFALSRSTVWRFLEPVLA